MCGDLRAVGMRLDVWRSESGWHELDVWRSESSWHEAGCVAI